MSDDPLRLDEADADLAAGRARPSSEVFAELGLLDATAWETVREYIAHNATSKETPRAEALAALASLQAAYEAMERERDERLAVNVGLIAENTELKRKIARAALEPRAEA